MSDYNARFEQKYKNIQIVEHGIVFLSKDETILFCNEKFASMVDIPHKELIGMPLREQTQHDDAADHAVFLWYFIYEDLQAFKIARRMHRNNGDIFYVKAEFHRINNNLDELMYRVVVFTEVSLEEYLDAL